MKFWRKQKLHLWLWVIPISLGLIYLNSVRGNELESSLPPLKTHPLPNQLQDWTIKEESGDYFWAIESHLVGYFIFSQFPVKVYLDRPTYPIDRSNFSQLRFQQWLEAVRVAIADWHEYFPIVEVNRAEEADIIIKREHPPINAQINPETGLYDLPRARSAQTSYQFYVSEDRPPLLLHRMSINISPAQNNDYIVAATRHELGHALGIWGHSDQKNDVMYFSQVRNSPPISPRDINTLKKIYQQPTRLGWSLPN
jgi:predicted Zn-dependent protease